jgi:hypothetical protein
VEQHKQAGFHESDIAHIGALLGVAAAAFFMLGVIIYFVGDDPSSQMSAANDTPRLTERMLRNKSAQSIAREGTVGQDTVGQGTVGQGTVGQATVGTVGQGHNTDE